MLYRLLLWLHPPAFRREFAGEMLWIFDETRGAAVVAMLFSDAAISLARQWLLRSGAWKLVAAAAGGLAHPKRQEHEHEALAPCHWEVAP